MRDLSGVLILLVVYAGVTPYINNKMQNKLKESIDKTEKMS